MMPRLRDEDRLAVDLLLDRAAAGPANGVTHPNGNGISGFSQVKGGVPEQVGRVQAVLQVLEMMPAEEPSADLMARTLRRVEAESAQHDPSALRPPQPTPAAMQMPHA
jgi:hypothetical protein